MAKEARLVALFAVLTLSHQQLVQAQARPGLGKRWLQRRYPGMTPRIASRPQSWINGLERGFKLAQFGNANLNLNGRFTLDHMVSWNAIVDVIGMELDKWQKKSANIVANTAPPQSLMDFVTGIFYIDPEAYVNNNFCSNQCYNGPHENIIEDQRPNPTLDDINDNQYNAALGAIQNIRNNMPVTRRTNGAHVRRLLKALNNAPANLRYGESRTNFSVGETCDPMGTDPATGTGTPTTFEGRICLYLASQYGLAGWTQDDNCPSGRSCIKSSTGFNHVNNVLTIDA